MKIYIIWHMALLKFRNVSQALSELTYQSIGSRMMQADLKTIRNLRFGVFEKYEKNRN
jgi:hypothetical protein